MIFGLKTFHGFVCISNLMGVDKRLKKLLVPFQIKGVR